MDEAALREAAEEAEFQRAKERLTLKHKNSSRWARRALRRGVTVMDQHTREALAEQLRMGQEIRQRVCVVGGIGGGVFVFVFIVSVVVVVVVVVVSVGDGGVPVLIVQCNFHMYPLQHVTNTPCTNPPTSPPSQVNSLGRPRNNDSSDMSDTDATSDEDDLAQQNNGDTNNNNNATAQMRTAAMDVLLGNDVLPEEEVPTKGLFSLPFMQRAMQRKQAEVKQAAEKMLHELDEGADKDAMGGGAQGRLRFDANTNGGGGWGSGNNNNTADARYKHCDAV